MSPMRQLGKVIAKAMEGGVPGAIPRDLGEALASHPPSVADVVRLLFAESRKKRANSQLILAFSIMLEKALESARWREENGSIAANDLAATVRAAVLKERPGEKANTKALMAISRSFSAAKVDLGAELSRVIEADLELETNVDPKFVHDDLERTFANLAEELEHNCFLIYEQLRDLINFAPIEPRLALIATLAASSTPSLRDAIAGFLLDADSSVGNGVAGILAQSASKGLVSAATVGRLVIMRNWLDEDRRSTIDAIIRAAQHKGISAAPHATAQISEILVSPCDGAGAQSWFVILRERRKYSIAALLNKHGFGLRDAWLRPSLTEMEAKAFLVQIEFEMSNFSSSLDRVRTALEHGVAAALAKGEAIPFGLLQFIEATGIAPFTPREHPPEALLDQLLADLPKERLDERTIMGALTRSKRWEESQEWLDTWFEDSEAALAAALRGKTKKEKIGNVLQEVISHRRRYWGELLAWTALGVSDDPADDNAEDFVLVARELLGSRPLSEIPLAVLIAKKTIEATQGR
ncbi:hypothetical protein [Methylocystis sp.]|uniref:hypothetical protein n=1 Tax=Methylocystis sp. TaxID=1911079 RepID=UPI003D0EDE18